MNQDYAPITDETEFESDIIHENFSPKAKKNISVIVLVSSFLLIFFALYKNNVLKVKKTSTRFSSKHVQENLHERKIALYREKISKETKLSVAYVIFRGTPHVDGLMIGESHDKRFLYKHTWRLHHMDWIDDEAYGIESFCWYN